MTKGSDALKNVRYYVNDSYCKILCEKDIEIVEKELKAFEFIKNNLKIEVYHTRHNETGYEMRIVEKGKPFKLEDCLFIENISEEQYLLFKELKDDKSIF